MWIFNAESNVSSNLCGASENELSRGGLFIALHTITMLPVDRIRTWTQQTQRCIPAILLRDDPSSYTCNRYTSARTSLPKVYPTETVNVLHSWDYVATYAIAKRPPSNSAPKVLSNFGTTINPAAAGSILFNRMARLMQVREEHKWGRRRRNRRQESTKDSCRVLKADHTGTKWATKGKWRLGLARENSEGRRQTVS